MLRAVKDMSARTRARCAADFRFHRLISPFLMFFFFALRHATPPLLPKRRARCLMIDAAKSIALFH
jgi:hypothetical protein